MTHVMTTVALFALLLGNPGPKDSYRISQEQWKTLSELNYNITYPSAWELNQSKVSGTDFILFARGTEEGKFRENINLLIQDLTGRVINLDKYVEITEQQIASMLNNAKIISSKRMKTATGEYHEIIYSGDQASFSLKWKQYYWVIGEKAYVLTFTGTQTTYDSFIRTADKLMNSFAFK